MIRLEYIIAGLILAGIGIGLCITGYNKMQPTTLDRIVTFTEEISGEKASPEMILLI